MLKISNLHVETEGKEILKGLCLTINDGEIHALMGPNGAGKSTLAKVLAGHPAYQITQGFIEFEGKDLLDLDPEERVHLGLFLSFQYPLEIPGVTNRDFLFESFNAQKKARSEKIFSKEEFNQYIQSFLQKLQINPEFLNRSLNEGFSGGEKKRNEILQMNVFSPKLAAPAST